MLPYNTARMAGRAPCATDPWRASLAIARRRGYSWSPSATFSTSYLALLRACDRHRSGAGPVCTPVRRDRRRACSRCSRCITRCSRVPASSAGSRQRSCAAYERSVYVWIVEPLFICGLCAVAAGAGRAVDGSPTVDGRSSWRCSCSAILLGVRAAGRIDVLDLAGIRQAFGRAGPRTVRAQPDRLYGLVRHPIYLGWLLLVWATPAMTGTRLVFAAISTLYLAGGDSVRGADPGERCSAATLRRTYARGRAVGRDDAVIVLLTSASSPGVPTRRRPRGRPSTGARESRSARRHRAQLTLSSTRKRWSRSLSNSARSRSSAARRDALLLRAAHPFDLVVVAMAALRTRQRHRLRLGLLGEAVALVEA